LLITSAIVAASMGTALAADLPSHKAPPVFVPPPPPLLWTGFYVGLNAGGTFSSDSTVSTIAAPIYIHPGIRTASEFAAAAAASSWLSPSNGGFIGGGQVGYNYQFTNFVVGLEADIQGIATSGNGINSLAAAPTGSGGNFWAGTTQVTGSLDYLGTVRERVGYLVLPSLLVYGTGGLAYGGVSTSTSVFDVGVRSGGNFFNAPGIYTGASSYSDTLVGWTAGGGVEWMFLPNWSAKLEYLYYDLGTVTSNFVLTRPSTTFANGVAGFAAAQTTARFDGNIIRAGVNYHFNWAAPAPVIAKY
ncbi:MAG TPA: outer membrane beta-barrel protein, partial [Methylocystis sp.]|nr:outer membrane beta-barrel protein [Methylocystis sp.]